MKGFSVFAAFVGTVMMVIALIIGLTFIQNHITLNRMAVGIKSDTELYDAIQEIRALVYSTMNYNMLKGIKQEIESQNFIYFCENERQCLKRGESFINKTKEYVQSSAITKALNDIKSTLIARGINIIDLTSSVSSMSPKLVWNETGTYIVLNSTNITAEFSYKGKSSTIVVSSPINYTMKLPWDFIHIVNKTSRTTGKLLEKVEHKKVYLTATCRCNCSCECANNHCWCKGCTAESKGVVSNILGIWNNNQQIYQPGGYHKIKGLGCYALYTLIGKDRAQKDLKKVLNKNISNVLNTYPLSYGLNLTVLDTNITITGGGDTKRIREELVGIYEDITDSICVSYACKSGSGCCCSSYTIRRTFFVTNITTKINITANAECSGTGEPTLNITLGFTNK